MPSLVRKDLGGTDPTGRGDCLLALWLMSDVQVMDAASPARCEWVELLGDEPTTPLAATPLAAPTFAATPLAAPTLAATPLATTPLAATPSPAPAVARVAVATVVSRGLLPDDSGAVIPTLVSAARSDAQGKPTRADADGEPDDLPAPVASTRPFTMPKIVRRIAVPAATAATSELDSSAELDLPQLAAMTSLPPAIETVVATPRPAGSTRPDDVDLDLDDLHGAPSEPPIAKIAISF